MNYLSCSGISKKFGGTQALDNVSAEFPSAIITAVIGPNGAGKTTLLNVLSGYIRPDSGTCLLGDTRIDGVTPYKIARYGIARTFQELRLVRDVTVLENVLLSCKGQLGESVIGAILGIGVGPREKLFAKKAEELLSRVDLGDFAGELAGNMSFGQQKLLSLVCCIATEARIFLLDEPVAGVATETINEVLSLLRSCAERGTSIVFVEHDIDAVREIADRVIVMDHGRVIAHGETNDILGRSMILDTYID